MRETVEIKLAKPLVTHDGSLSRIVLREPTYDEYLTIGDPFTVAGTRDGTPFAVENMEVIKQYVAVCLVEPKDPALLSQAGARVAKRVKEGILSFFQPDEAEGEGLGNSRTNSASGSGNQSSTSSD